MNDGISLASTVEHCHVSEAHAEACARYVDQGVDPDTAHVRAFLDLRDEPLAA